MPTKKDFVLKIDSQWRVKLTGVDEEVGTVDDVVIDREDGRFFKMVLTRALGFIFPMFFETLNKNERAGTVCLIVREDSNNNKYVVVENKPYVNYRGEKTTCVRACRSSISAPEGSPIPAGTKKDNILHLHPIEINNMRLAGPVETYVVFQPFNAPLEAGQQLMLLKDFAKTDDCPGQAVLLQYLLNQ